MSEQQYNQLLKIRLTDLPSLQASALCAILANRPAWLRDMMIRCLVKAD
ncbi:Uncharacterised protein [Serratia ficaria]|nr:Uncharacterised protein [Serratia ficaria]CAI2030693.1 Uncharacterised protein [Serratia ficaria]CAI2528134.1 Uncharacterised protein [Serratia ficaria]CAI2540219.1 Uncharacterised protein [Serratia ficaria]CAI2794194.1 Uncharacterised protein [Serratia ficaria]